MPRIPTYPLAGSVSDNDLMLIDDISEVYTTKSLEIGTLKGYINTGQATTTYVDDRVISGASFNTSNGILTLTRATGANVTENLDGRYALLSSVYTDADVDAHLNTSTAAPSQVLSWTGFDYSWVPQSGGGGGGVVQVNTASPLLGGPITTSGTISITKADATTDGYLSSTDWNTFNNKSDFDGQYSSLTGAPALAAVATSGDYNDLSNTPFIPSGTVTSVGLSMPSAFALIGSPVTSAGVFIVTGAGNASQYIDGTGSLQTFPTIPTVPANIVETITTTDGSFINLTPNAATDGNVTVTADLSATGTADATTFLRGDNTWAAPSGGTVTSVGLSMPAAFTVTNSPVTSSGTLTVTGAGTAAEYIDGTGALRTFATPPTIPTQVVTFMEWTGATNPYFNFTNGVDVTIPFDNLVLNSSTSPTQTPTVVTTVSTTQTTFEVTDPGTYRVSVNLHFYDLFADIDVFCGVYDTSSGLLLSEGGLMDKKDITANTDQNFFGSSVMSLAPGTVFELRANFSGGTGQNPYPSNSGQLVTSVLIERVDGTTAGGGGGGAQSLNDLTDASTISGGNANSENLILGPVASNLPNICTTGCFGGNIILQASTLNNPTGLRNGTRNVIIGRSGQALENGSHNVVIGDAALINNVDGSDTVAIGNSAFRYNTKQFGTGNTGVGFYAGAASTTGGQITSIGYLSGWNTTSAVATGSNITTIGYQAWASSNSVSDEITLGNSSVTALRCAVTSITSLSDERDKKDITDLEYGLDFIESLQPKQFVWDNRPEILVTKDEEGNEVTEEIHSSNKGKKDFGFIAQDVQPLDNDILRLVYAENPDKLEMSYGKLVPILVKAVKELSDKVKALEAKQQ